MATHLYCDKCQGIREIKEVKNTNDGLRGRCKKCGSIIFSTNLLKTGDTVTDKKKSFFDLRNLNAYPTDIYIDGERKPEWIFISYASQDYEPANRLFNSLKNRGLNPWLDKENLLPGQDWNREIKKAIVQSKYFIPLFSSTSINKRGYVQRELRIAIDTLDEMPEDQVFVIPVRLEPCTIPYEKLLQKQYQDMFPDWDKGIERILRVIEKI